MESIRGEYSRVLINLSYNISREDRLLAASKLKISIVTIDTYLKGGGSNMDVADKLVVFFTDRIKQRLTNIQELSSFIDKTKKEKIYCAEENNT